jgi:hypothetical protein
MRGREVESVQCPACSRALEELEAGGIRVDVCRQGCLGIWFDRFELDRVDEAHEGSGEALLDLQASLEREPDKSARHKCPRDGAVLRRHWFSAQREVEVDTCPQCSGVWLDAGELARIRQTSAAEREQAIEQLFGEQFEEELSVMRRESEEQRARARAIARALRWICPSYWIPGKQSGAAF